MLRHKRIEAERVDLPVGSQQLLMRRHGFRRGTVPGLKLDGRRIQGTLAISRALEQAKPEPPLFPADPAERAAVEEAERWGDRIYQPVPRRIFRWAVAHDRELRKGFGRIGGVPSAAVSLDLLWPVSQMYMRFEGGGEKAVRRDLEQLPEHLDHVDELIAAGTLDGEHLNAADFQIASSTRVLLNFAQLRPLIEDRPAAAHAMRLLPNFGGELPVKLPGAWVPGPARPPV
jgi:glutathione S-transferase